jgi:hypothetical protein
VGFILRQRRSRAHPEESADSLIDIDVNVQEFMKTCSLRQLRLLREIALGLGETVERVH